MNLSSFFFTIAGTISAGSGNAILDFLVQAWNPTDGRIGTFATGAGQQNLDCSSVNSVPAAVSVRPIASLLNREGWAKVLWVPRKVLDKLHLV